MLWEIVSAIVLTSRGFWSGVGVLIVVGGLVVMGEQGGGALAVSLIVLALGLYVRVQKQRAKRTAEITVVVEKQP